MQQITIQQQVIIQLISMYHACSWHGESNGGCLVSNKAIAGTLSGIEAASKLLVTYAKDLNLQTASNNTRRFLPCSSAHLCKERTAHLHRRQAERPGAVHQADPFYRRVSNSAGDATCLMLSSIQVRKP